MADRRPNCRSGQTLLELIAATTIIAITLVPALRMMRDSLRVSRDTERANLLATLAASKLEEHLLSVAGSWAPSTVSGNFAADGYPTVRFRVVRSDNPTDGGLTNSLMSITSTVWDDTDSDGSHDTNELRAVFASKMARIAAYQNEAAGP